MQEWEVYARILTLHWNSQTRDFHMSQRRHVELYHIFIYLELQVRLKINFNRQTQANLATTGTDLSNIMGAQESGQSAITRIEVYTTCRL